MLVQWFTDLPVSVQWFAFVLLSVVLHYFCGQVGQKYYQSENQWLGCIGIWSLFVAGGIGVVYVIALVFIPVTFLTYVVHLPYWLSAFLGLPVGLILFAWGLSKLSHKKHNLRGDKQKDGTWIQVVSATLTEWGQLR